MHNLRLKIFYCLSKTVSVHDPSPSERSTLISYDNKSESWGGGHFPPFRYFPNFQHNQNTCYLLNTTFIFDRCHRSKAAATPVKYECDSRNLTGNFAQSNISITEKFTNGASVTPSVVIREQKLCTVSEDMGRRRHHIWVLHAYVLISQRTG